MKPRKKRHTGVISQHNTTWQSVTHSQTGCSCEARLPWVPLWDNIIQITAQNPTKRTGCQQLNYFKLKAKATLLYSLSPQFHQPVLSPPAKRHMPRFTDCFLGEIYCCNWSLSRSCSRKGLFFSCQQPLHVTEKGCSRSETDLDLVHYVTLKRITLQMCSSCFG